MRHILPALVLCLLIVVPAVAGPGMWSSVTGLQMSFNDCKARVANALDREGYGNLRDFGNGWVGFTDDFSASVGCIRGDNETVLAIVVAGNGDVRGANNRLLALVRGGRDDGGQRTGGEPANWGTRADPHRGQNGQRFTYNCPAGGDFGSVWGTEVYTDDSSICTAAVHAGMITRERGGTVTIEIRPGQSGYQGTSRNGVNSGQYGGWHGSFVFVGAPTRPTDEAQTVEWNVRADQWRGQNGRRFTVRCRPGGDFGSVWGDGVYTDDSSICTAAVHQGLIARERGGTVTIEIRPGQSSYAASQRNGVSTGSYGGWHGSFVFVR